MKDKMFKSAEAVIEHIKVILSIYDSSAAKCERIDKCIREFEGNKEKN